MLKKATTRFWSGTSGVGGLCVGVGGGEGEPFSRDGRRGSGSRGGPSLKIWSMSMPTLFVIVPEQVASIGTWTVLILSCGGPRSVSLGLVGLSMTLLCLALLASEGGMACGRKKGGDVW